jgi:hypothetical protein
MRLEGGTHPGTALTSMGNGFSQAAMPLARTIISLGNRVFDFAKALTSWENIAVGWL